MKVSHYRDVIHVSRTMTLTRDKGQIITTFHRYPKICLFVTDDLYLLGKCNDFFEVDDRSTDDTQDGRSSSRPCQCMLYFQR